MFINNLNYYTAVACLQKQSGLIFYQNRIRSNNYIEKDI